MSGRKHHLQHAGLQAGDNDFNKIKDPIERDLSFQSINLVPYCKKCGQQVLPPAMEERRDYELEKQWQMHEDCIREVEAELKAKVKAEQQEKARLAQQKKDIDWDEYIRQHFANKGE